jgi:predicted AAA+ superfamily ATPase
MVKSCGLDWQQSIKMKMPPLAEAQHAKYTFSTNTLCWQTESNHLHDNRSYMKMRLVATKLDIIMQKMNNNGTFIININDNCPNPEKKYMFNRRAVEEITSWFNREKRKPLVIRGARQVGKTTAVRLAASKLSTDIIEINLERHTELEPLFKSYKLEELLFNFSLISGKQFNRASKAILFLDEAQATPSAYSCLRYFWEDMPELAIILTGSLLDQVLHNYNIPNPVGRIEHCFMGPLTFEEFLAATGESKALATIAMLKLNTMHLIPDSVHEEMMAQVRRYSLCGGMPYCVQIAIDTQFNHSEIVKYQTELLQSYKDDFTKYTGSQTALQLNAFFNGIIGQIGLQFSHKQANEIALNTSGDNRQLNAALERFLEARLFYRVVHSGAEVIPLGGETKIRISKFLFIDIGLLLAAQGIPAQTIMNSPLELAYRGIIAEQFTGQQLLYAKPSYTNPSLYYWQPPKAEGQAEIDFLFENGNQIYPVEVKSGSRGTIKSLHSYVIKKKSSQAIKISSAKPSVQELTAKMNKEERAFRLINIPFYLVNQLERIVNEKS